MRTAATLLQANDHHLDRVLDYLKSPEPAEDDMEIVFANATRTVVDGHKRGELYVWQESPDFEPDGFIVGSPSTGHLRCMEVRNTCRCRGLGPKILSSFSEIASQHDIPGLFGECRTESLRFWRRQGFETPIGEAFDERLLAPDLFSMGFIPPVGVRLYKPLFRKDTTTRHRAVSFRIELRFQESDATTVAWDLIGFGDDDDEITLPVDWIVPYPRGSAFIEFRFLLKDHATPWLPPGELDWLGVESTDYFIRIRVLRIGDIEASSESRTSNTRLV